MNEYLLLGGSQGGMGPGAAWEPFKVEKKEYDELISKIKKLEPELLGDSARYTYIKFEFDDSFDYIESWEDWLSSVCEKHRKSFHKKMGNA